MIWPNHCCLELSQADLTNSVLLKWIVFLCENVSHILQRMSILLLRFRLLLKQIPQMHNSYALLIFHVFLVKQARITKAICWPALSCSIVYFLVNKWFLIPDCVIKINKKSLFKESFIMYKFIFPQLYFIELKHTHLSWLFMYEILSTAQLDCNNRDKKWHID